MVNLTAALFRKHPFNVKQDPFWRKRQIFRLAAHFYGRGRNCFSVAIRHVQRSLQNVTKGREIRHRAYHRLWSERITAGAQEVGYLPQGTRSVLEGLAQTKVLLNHQVLANLAIWEPRTFKSLNKIAAARANDPESGIGNTDQLGPPPAAVAIPKDKL